MAIRKRGNKWLAVVFRGYAPGATGQPKRLEHSRTFTLRKDAERWLREQKSVLERGDWVPPSQISVNQFLDQWERGTLRLGSQRDRTKLGYVWLLNAYIRPRLGETRLGTLTRASVQAAAADLLVQPIRSRIATDQAESRCISPVTARRALAAFSVALEEAVDQRLISANPARRIRLPRVPRTASRWLAREEVHRLLAGTSEDRLGGLWSVLVGTGLRPSEALALQWDAVDFGAGVVRVRQTLVPTKKTPEGKTWRIEEPKTSMSRRSVPLPVETVRALTSQRDRQGAERLAAGSGYSEYSGGGFVFAKENGEPMREDAVLQVFQRALAKLSLPRVTLYSLRHAHATLLLESGVPLRLISDRLGHSSVSVTGDVYAHVTSELQEHAVRRFEVYMTPRPDAPDGAR